MSKQTVYEYVNTFTTINMNDFSMIHQYALDKIRSGNFGSDYRFVYTTLPRAPGRSGICTNYDFVQAFQYYDTREDFIDLLASSDGSKETISITSLYNVVNNMPLTAYKCIYDHIEYPAFIHKYLLDHKITKTSTFPRGIEYHGGRYDFLITDDIRFDNYRYDLYDKMGNGPHVIYSAEDDTEWYACKRILYDTYPQYIKPKRSKEEYIKYFVANDFNGNRLRVLIIELTKLMLKRREEDIKQYVKEDVIVDDLQLLIDHTQQMIIECKEYFDKQMDAVTVKLSI